MNIGKQKTVFQYLFLAVAGRFHTGNGGGGVVSMFIRELSLIIMPNFNSAAIFPFICRF